jgi:hypothetical protein
MGAWGAGSFDNDDAMEWADELMDSGDTEAIEEALEAVTVRDKESLEAPDACVALAAAEVVAALNNAAGPDLPDDLQKWIRKQKGERQDLVQLALRAIKRVRTESELKILWEESGDAGEWYENISNLEERLKG